MTATTEAITTTVARTAPAPRRGRPRRGEEQGLTRDQVVAAVLRLAEANPDAEINMRELAQHLGVSPKLLYLHASGKDELLDLAAKAILEQWTMPAAELPWPDRFAAIMQGTRALTRRFPALSQAVLLRNLEARESPEVRQVVSAINGCLIDAGLTPDEARQIFFLYEALILGELTMLKAVRDGTLSGDNLPSQNELDTGFETGLRYAIAGIRASRVAENNT